MAAAIETTLSSPFLLRQRFERHSVILCRLSAEFLPSFPIMHKRSSNACCNFPLETQQLFR